MKKIKSLFSSLTILSVFIFVFTGCAQTTYYTANYNLNIEKVETSNEKKFFTPKEKTLHFEDKIIDITWIPKHKYFEFTLKNKTSNTIKVLWDDVVIIDNYNNSQGAIHKGIKYNEKSQSQTPTKVIRQSKISEIIVPKDNIEYYKGWKIKDILRDSINYPESIGTFNTSVKENVKEHTKLFVNSTIQIMLPIQLKNKTIEYIFVFKVNGFDTVIYNSYTY